MVKIAGTELRRLDFVNFDPNDISGECSGENSESSNEGNERCLCDLTASVSSPTKRIKL